MKQIANNQRCIWQRRRPGVGDDCGPVLISRDCARRAASSVRHQNLFFAAAALTLVLGALAVTGCAGRYGDLKPPPLEVKLAVNPGSAPNPKLLSGAELYAINCNRCHPERSAVERNAAEWQTILLHMRVRANLPAAQAGAILDYLQANSGS